MARMTAEEREFHTRGVRTLLQTSLKDCPTSCILEAIAREFHDISSDNRYDPSDRVMRERAVSLRNLAQDLSVEGD